MQQVHALVLLEEVIKGHWRKKMQNIGDNRSFIFKHNSDIVLHVLPLKFV